MTVPDTGLEWIIDAEGCSGLLLADLDRVRGCCNQLIDLMHLQVVGTPQWRQFDGPGGVTGLYLLSESHLSCHTFPEFGLACLNIYSCRPRSAPDWDQVLGEWLQARSVRVRRLSRGLTQPLTENEVASHRPPVSAKEGASL